MKRVLSAFLFNVEIYVTKWQSFEKITSSDFPLSICLGDKYAISIQFESKKNTGKLFLPTVFFNTSESKTASTTEPLEA